MACGAGAKARGTHVTESCTRASVAGAMLSKSSSSNTAKPEAASKSRYVACGGELWKAACVSGGREESRGVAADALGLVVCCPQPRVLGAAVTQGAGCSSPVAQACVQAAGRKGRGAGVHESSTARLHSEQTHAPWRLCWPGLHVQVEQAVSSVRRVARRHARGGGVAMLVAGQSAVYSGGSLTVCDLLVQQRRCPPGRPRLYCPAGEVAQHPGRRQVHGNIRPIAVA